MRPLLEATVLSFIIVFFSACNNGKTNDNNLFFKQLNWEEDALKCREIDSDNLSLLDKNKKLLFGKNEKEVSDILNVPSKTELYTRGQKFFIYNINCDSTGIPKNNLRIRFNALGYVNEVLLLGKF